MMLLNKPVVLVKKRTASILERYAVITLIILTVTLRLLPLTGTGDPLVAGHMIMYPVTPVLVIIIQDRLPLTGTNEFLIQNLKSYSSRDRSLESSPHNRDRNFSGGRSHDYYKYNRDSSDEHIPRGILKSSDHYSFRRHSPSPKRQDDWDRKHRYCQSRTPPHSPSHGHHSAKHSSCQSYSPRDDRDRDGSKGCYACGSHDHFVKDCLTTSKSSSIIQCCFNCDSPNHFVKDCTHKSPRSRTPSPFNKNYNNVHCKDKGSKKTLNNNYMVQVLMSLPAICVKMIYVHPPPVMVSMAHVVMMICIVFHLLTVSWRNLILIFL